MHTYTHGLLRQWYNVDFTWAAAEFEKNVAMELGTRHTQHLEKSTVTDCSLDFVHEARNAEQCARNFKTRRDIVVPRIVWPLTSSRVLTMEFMHGNKVRKSHTTHIRGEQTCSNLW